MNFYLFKLRVSSGADDKLFHYRRDGIIAANSMKEAIEIVTGSYSEDLLGNDEAVIAQIIFLGGDNDDVCIIDSVKLDRLNEFFSWETSNGED